MAGHPTKRPDQLDKKIGWLGVSLHLQRILNGCSLYLNFNRGIDFSVWALADSPVLCLGSRRGYDIRPFFLSGRYACSVTNRISCGGKPGSYLGFVDSKQDNSHSLPTTHCEIFLLKLTLNELVSAVCLDK